ncbi:phosphatase PAP2 family protein [Arthrobacter sp. I2-34]|uniref:Phosphatase PAP2 family protein n=1 Tax=Arthrobacter hankyongi TaxID=2904801 RepID=A0ABS9LDA0_9MICC|nr:phosphatase PAP2 family protein [Arthrobacter hankyongi]MCG2624662.1 phosphatase PAP2 family protein [Arthrobacter hankyongi]
MTSVGQRRDLPAQARMAVLPQPRHWVLWPAVTALLTLVAGLVLVRQRGFTTAELGIDQAFSREHSSVATFLALTAAAVFSPAGGVVMIALLCLFLLLVRRSPVNAVAAGAIASTGWLSAIVFKDLVDRHRPDATLLADPLLAEPGTGSFPSGHTALAVSLAITVFLLARGTRWQWPALAGGAAVAVGVAASRVYLGVHYPTDVAASFLAAGSAIAFFTGLWNRFGIQVLARIPLLDRFGPVPGRC